MTQVDDAAFANQVFGRAAVSNRYHHARSWLRRGGERYAHFCSQRIKPRSRFEFIGIEPLAIGHEFAAVLFAIPGGQARPGSFSCQRRDPHPSEPKQKKSRYDQQAGRWHAQVEHARILKLSFRN